jgi:hypothetical protein
MRIPARGLLSTLCQLVAGAAAAADAPDPRAAFGATVSASRHVLEMRDGRAGGPAGEFLLGKARESEFVLLGEEHGVATIADAARAIALALQAADYRHVAIETDAWTARILERELRAGGVPGLARWMGEADHRRAIPFYGWSAEASLADAVVQGNRDALPALWGLDQVFAGAYGTLLADVAERATTPAAREQAAALATRARGNFGFLASLEEGALERLRAALDPAADRERLALLDDMIVSAGIYAPFMDRAGLSVYAANRTREDFMKRRFLDYWHAAGEPKVLFKFGANHMARGLSPTRVPALGGFLSDLALAAGGRAFNLLLLCGPGSQAGNFEGGTGECEIDVESAIPELAARVDPVQPVLFDLAPWKDVPAQWKHLPAEVRDLLWAYDAVLVVPDGKPARFLEAQAQR